ncbi:uncharacterized protein TNCV_4243271 [Trichonephila clavipes]|nr:uncharacterized protein TNCV_4243271 [Trichonephila clavipes]
MVDREKFTFVPTATPLATHACTLSSQITVVLGLSGLNRAAWGHIVFGEEFLFQLRPDDHRRRVWRRPGQRADPAFPITCHTGLQPCVVV